IVVNDSTGKAVMLGFSDLASGKPAEVSAKQTAVRLLYFALDAYSLPTADQALAISVLAADPSLPALTNVISTRMAANPTAIGDKDAAIIAAVIQARDDISNGGRAVHLFGRGAASKSLAPKSRSVGARSAPGARPSRSVTREES